MKNFLACLLGATMASAFAIFAYTFIALIFASLVLGVELSIKLWMIYAAGVLSLAVGLCYTLFEKEMLNLLEEDDHYD